MQGEITAWLVSLFLCKGSRAVTGTHTWHHSRAAISTGPASYDRSWSSLSEPFRSCLEVLIQAWYKPLWRSTAASWGSMGIKGSCCATSQPGEGDTAQNSHQKAKERAPKAKACLLELNLVHFYFFFYLSELWQEASYCCYAFQEIHERCSDKVMGR